MKFDFLALLFYLVPTITLEGLQAKEEQDYRKYHQQITETERLICDEKFEVALNLLEQVFNYYDFVFLKDYKIAAQLAFYLDQKEKALHFIREGIAAGWELKTIKKNGFLTQHLDEPDWKVIEKLYPDLRSEYLARIDHFIREKVQTMFKNDQWKALGALLRIGDKAQQRYAIKKFAPHSEIQLTKLITILENHGYPGEKLSVMNSGCQLSSVIIIPYPQNMLKRMLFTVLLNQC